MANRENPVTWLLGNREIMALLFVAFAWLAQRLGLAKNKGAATGAGREEAPAADDEAERTRRVQEEVRRKISERRAGAAPVPPASRSAGEPAPPIVAPRPVAYPAGGRWDEIFRPRMAEIPVPPEAPPDRQSDIEKRMIQLESASLAASAEAGGTSGHNPAPLSSQTGTAAPLNPAYAWLSQLREPQGARRAIVFREVLGPPVGLRR
ncbi:MAG: hypothetical protein ABSA05_13890 [Opitutaceae bacterium]|jgi:hypothetical protein